MRDKIAKTMAAKNASKLQPKEKKRVTKKRNAKSKGSATPETEGTTQKDTEIGRPPKYEGIDDEIVATLARYLERDCTVEQACSRAGINKTTFYSWIKKYPEFLDEMSRAQQHLLIESHVIVAEKVLEERDFATSWSILTHRERSRYRTAKTLLDQGTEELSEEEESELNELLKHAGFSEEDEANNLPDTERETPEDSRVREE